MPVLTAAGFGFVGYLTWCYWRELSSQISAMDAGWTIGSLLLLLASNASASWLFAILVERADRTKSGRLELAGSFLFSQIAKYLPGRVWGVVQQSAVLANRVGVRVIVLVNIELALVILTLTTGIGIALALLAQREFAAAGLVFLAGWGAAQVLLFAGIARQLLIWVSKWRRLPAIPEPLGTAVPRQAATVSAMSSCLLFMSMYCLGWLTFLWGALGLDAASSIRAAALLALSGVLGTLSLLPAGLGAREAAIVALGAWLGMDTASAAAVAVVTRLAILALDLMSVPLGWAILRLETRWSSGHG